MMEVKIIKIDGEFVIVELNNGGQKVCPAEIFPKEIKLGDRVQIIIVNKKYVY